MNNFWLLLQEEDETKPILARNDSKEILLFYQQYYDKNIREGEYTKKPWGLLLSCEHVHFL